MMLLLLLSSSITSLQKEVVSGVYAVRPGYIELKSLPIPSIPIVTFVISFLACILVVPEQREVLI